MKAFDFQTESVSQELKNFFVSIKSDIKLTWAGYSYCSKLWNVLYLCLSVQTVQPENPLSQCHFTAQRAWPLILQSKPFDCLMEQASGVIIRWMGDAETWTQTWTLSPHQLVALSLSPLNLSLKSQNKLREFWVFVRLVEDVENWPEQVSSFSCASVQSTRLKEHMKLC